MYKGAFNQQVAIVTGAGQGIGFEIARKLSLYGANVILNDVDEDLAIKATEKIFYETGSCVCMPGDASDVEFIQRMIDEAVNRFGNLTLAVANAGLSLYGDFFEYTKNDFERVMKLNLGGSFFLAQAAAKQIKTQKSGGSILFMSSVCGHQALKDLAAYSMTKSALEMLAKNLVVELAPYNISVNALAPGATITERTITFENYYEAWSKITPSGKPASVEDIANSALFLLSKEARHITGQSLIVDGGWTCISPSPPDK